MKKNYRYSFAIICTMLFFSISSAQERIYINKEEFKQTEDGFTEAWKNVKKANYLFYQHRDGSYFKAIPFYLEANKYNSENAELNLLIGISYLRSWPKEKALVYLQKAYDLKNEIHPKINFLLGKAYQYNAEYNKAILAYNDYKDGLSKGNSFEIIKIVDKYIEECENALLLVKKPIRALVDNMGPKINSVFDDYNPGISADGEFMAFTSRREGISKLKSQLDHKYFEDIFTSKKVGNEWEAAQNIDRPVNSQWNDALVKLSDDGLKMIIYKGRTEKGDLFSASKKADGWGSIQRLSGKINKNKSQESSLCFNENGNKVYFVSDKATDSQGGKDIYYSVLDEKGRKWSKPVNLGPTINTAYDEVSVFISPDESTLYFSSYGHNTIGGFDIFKSEFKNEEWTEPENLGVPINTNTDDIFFSIMPNKRDAFYSSDNQLSNGGFDIFSVTLLGPEKPYSLANKDELIAGLVNPEFDFPVEDEVEILYTKMTVVKGLITDFNTGLPLEAVIELIDNANGNKVKETLSNKNTGSYMIALPSGKNYGFSVNAEGYMFHSENYNVPEASGFKEIFKDVQLQPMTAGSKIILYNTFFKSGKSDLSPESFSELNRVARMFEKYPNLVIEISGHTDNRGSVTVNKRISLARAKAVVDYLIGQGVKPSNLKAVGYYFLQPVANNKTADGRQQNRRVEAKIISN